MDKTRVEGVGHQIKGAVKEAAGKVTGNKQTEAEGKAEQVGGKAEGAYGNAKDGIKDALKK